MVAATEVSNDGDEQEDVKVFWQVGQASGGGGGDE